MTSPVKFHLCSSLAPGAICVETVKSDPPSRLVSRDSDEGLALAVLKAKLELKPGAGVVPEITGPPSPDFDTWLGMYLASRSLQSKMSGYHDLDEFKCPLASASRGSTVDVRDLKGHLPEVLRLVSYSQRERKGMTINCPIPQRLSSLHRALQRLFPDDFKSWESAWDQITTKYEKRDAQHPGRDPLFEGPFEDQGSGASNWWLKVAVQRLKTDREAYERDVQRAIRRQEIGYAMLPLVDKTWTPVEMIRIDAPESLLFEVWAWEDVVNSKDAGGFPLVWIDRGWVREDGEKGGFEIHLHRRPEYAPLTGNGGLNLSAEQVANDGFSLLWNQSGAAAEVRVSLKQGFFTENKVYFEDHKPTASEPDPRGVCIHELILDSELAIEAKIPKNHPIGPDNWRLCKVKLRSELDIWGTWAGDEVARILYSALRPASKMRLPNDFETHVSRHDRMVCVWTREGIAVACEGNLPDQFEKTFKHIFELRTDIQSVLKEEDEGQKNKSSRWKRLFSVFIPIVSFFREHLTTKSRGKEEQQIKRSLAKRHAQLRRELTQNPKLRALRSLFERTQPQELFDAWRDMYETEERLDSEDRHGFLEIGILVVYITELCEMLGGLVLENHPKLVLIGMLILAGSGVWCAYLLLRPRKKFLSEPKTVWAMVVLMLLPIFLSVFFAPWTKPARPLASPPVHAAPAASGVTPAASDHSVGRTSNQEIPHSASRKPDTVLPHPVPAIQGSQKK